MTDYTTLSGADFQREAGTDPIKWAEAFLQRHPPFKELPTHEDQVGYLSGLVRPGDAIEAGRLERPSPRAIELHRRLDVAGRLYPDPPNGTGGRRGASRYERRPRHRVRPLPARQGSDLHARAWCNGSRTDETATGGRAGKDPQRDDYKGLGYQWSSARKEALKARGAWRAK